jgi:hypothetical protein
MHDGVDAAGGKREKDRAEDADDVLTSRAALPSSLGNNPSTERGSG